MKIVKLNAIDSTNSYLKNLIAHSNVENWTVVVAKHQTSGKGQFDNNWYSAKGKNLTFSILVKFNNLKARQQFYLNLCISVALFNVLKYYIPENLAVKWPNDILSGNQKVCGVLIESSINNTNVNHAIIGIGLNVNQTKFPSNILNVSSLKTVLNKTINKEELLDKILFEIQYQLHLIQQYKFQEIKMEYEKVLYKKGVPAMFIDNNNSTFLGKIIEVSDNGKLRIELSDESTREFDLKEIKFKNLGSKSG